MVDTLVELGARLEVAIRTQALLPDPVLIVALDADSDEWQLVAGLPRGLSRLTFYEQLQSLISRLELPLSLDRIVLAKDDDPGWKELKGAASLHYRGSTWGIRMTPVEVGGRMFLSPLRTRVSSRAFESQVFEMVRTAFPDDIYSLRELEEERIDRSADRWPARVAVDFAVRVGDALVLVETKARTRPLGHAAVLTSLGALTYERHLSGSNVCMLLVSMSGYVGLVEESMSDFPHFRLLTWQGHEGPQPLVKALASLTSSRI